MKDCPKVSGLIAHTKEVRVPLSVFCFVPRLKIGTWNSCKWCNRSHAQVPKVFLCVQLMVLSPPTCKCRESFFAWECTQQACRKRGAEMSEKKGHTGSCLCSCLIVLEAFICQGISWESGGNQIILVMFIDCSTPTVKKKGHLHAVTLSQYQSPQLQEDALMIKLFLCCAAWRWAHPPYLLILPSFCLCLTKLKARSKTNRKYAFSRANMRMFENFSPQVVVTSGFARCQRSANNKAEATSKIIKVSFLRTFMVRLVSVDHLEDTDIQKA